MSTVQNKSILFTTTSAASLLLLNSTLLPVALPTIQRNLNFSLMTLYWIINSYPLLVAIFVVVGGKIGDTFGHRRFFCIGLLLYAFAAILGGMAQSGKWLVISRGIQGFGGALLSPAIMAIIIHAFPEGKRGRAIGILVAISSLFLILGPTLGGIVTEYLSWRFVFWINLPFALLSLLLAWRVLPRSPRYKKPFDFFGFIFFSLALFFLILALMQSSYWGWISKKTGGLLLISTLFFMGLAIRSYRISFPFIPFTLFQKRLFLGGTVLMACAQFILSITLFWPLYFQRVFMDSPLIAGLLTTAGSIPLMLTAPYSGVLVDRKGARFPIAIGFFVLVTCFIWFALFLSFHSILLLTPALVLLGFGLSFVITPTGTAALSAAPEEETGVATGMYTMFRFASTAIGFAVLSAVQTTVQNAQFDPILKKYPDLSSDVLEKIKESSIGLRSPETFSTIFSGKIVDSVRELLLDAISYSFIVMNWIVASIALFALLFTLFFFRKKKSTRKSKKNSY